MGNILGSKISSSKEPHDTWSFGFGGHNVPKHLRPSRQVRKNLKTTKATSNSKQEEPNNNNNNNNQTGEDDGERVERLVRDADVLSENDGDEGDAFVQNYTVDPMFSTGPQGAFRWFKGRRFAFSNKRGVSSALPSDPEELDRTRVLNYVLRWVFGGTVLAPVEEQLQKGCRVLNVGSGPGMWLGHPIMDMALDYTNSKFTAVDVCDLMPQTDLTNHFDQESSSISPSIVIHETNMAMTTTTTTAAAAVTIDFTPVHPILANVDPSISQIPSPNSLPVHSNININNSSSSNSSSSNVSPSSAYSSSSISSSTFSSPQETQSCPRLPARAPNFCPTVVSSTGTEPTKKKILENLDFYIVKLPEDSLPFEDNTFDFVQQRMASSNYSLLEWKKIMTEMARVTKPGGYVQLLETDYLLHSLGPKGVLWLDELTTAFRERRKGEPRIACYINELLLAVGFQDIKTTMVSVPVGAWGLDIGLLWQQNVDAFIQASMPLMVNVLQMSPSEFKRRWRETCDEVNDSKTFTNIHCGWAQKPVDKPAITDWSLCELYR